METETKKKIKKTKSKRHNKSKNKSGNSENNLIPVKTVSNNSACFDPSSIGQKEAFEKLLSERESRCKNFIEMKTSKNYSKLPNINEHYTKRPIQTQASKEKISTNLLIKKKMKKRVSVHPSMDKMLSKESHHKNLEFLKKLTEKVELAKTLTSTSKDKNIAERNKLIKVHYSRPEKRETKDTKIVYYYSVMPGNNSQLIKNAMAFRDSWKEDNTLYNFRWQQCSNGIDYSVLNKGSNCRQVNLLNNRSLTISSIILKSLIN
jgi:hypothetical protein